MFLLPEWQPEVNRTVVPRKQAARINKINIKIKTIINSQDTTR
jgi:hypothetical protein